MIFYGEPNLLVRVNKNIPGNRRLKHFRFDAEGKFETDNPRLIKALQKRFRCENEETKVFTCKTCGETFDNRGKLLAHAKTHKGVK